MITSSIIPLIIVLLLGGFALFVLKGFISKLPNPSKVEKKLIEETPKMIEEEEVQEVAPKVDFNIKESQSQRDQTITALNDAIMGSPEEAAKLITSYIRE